jgi:hypothetical protein
MSDLFADSDWSFLCHRVIVDEFYPEMLITKYLDYCRGCLPDHLLMQLEKYLPKDPLVLIGNIQVDIMSNSKSWFSRRGVAGCCLLGFGKWF